MRRLQLRADVKSLRKDILRTIHELNQSGDTFNLDEIALRVGCVEKTARLHIGKLAASGYLQKQSGKGRTPNLYRLLPPAYEVLGLSIHA